MATIKLQPIDYDEFIEFISDANNIKEIPPQKVICERLTKEEEMNSIKKIKENMGIFDNDFDPANIKEELFEDYYDIFYTFD